MSQSRPVNVFLVAGEHSGDRLAGPLIHEIRRMVSPRKLVTAGVGGEAMAEAGCDTLFPLSEIAVMGPFAILTRLPGLIRRVHQTVDAAVAMDPDVLIILDSPEFTHAVAKRVRAKLPGLPVINYVSPSVWAWRPGRARRMRAYVDHILAILPFEPETHKRLGGPRCTYVGHPLIERLDWIRSRDTGALRKRLGIDKGTPVMAILPGSRVNEIHRMMPVYGKTVSELIRQHGPVEAVIPVASGSEQQVRKELHDWPFKAHLLEGEDDKFTAFRMADAALATSGTVTLELALAGTPMVVAYKTEAIVARFLWMMKAHSIVLPNLVMGKNIFPEYIQEKANPDDLAKAIAPLLDKKSPEYLEQAEALEKIKDCMALESGTPSEKAARIVLSYIEKP